MVLVEGRRFELEATALPLPLPFVAEALAAALALALAVVLFEASGPDDEDVRRNGGGGGAALCVFHLGRCTDGPAAALAGIGLLLGLPEAGLRAPASPSCAGLAALESAPASLLDACFSFPFSFPFAFAFACTWSPSPSTSSASRGDDPGIGVSGEPGAVVGTAAATASGAAATIVEAAVSEVAECDTAADAEVEMGSASSVTVGADLPGGGVVAVSSFPLASGLSRIAVPSLGCEDMTIISGSAASPSVLGSGDVHGVYTVRKGLQRRNARCSSAITILAHLHTRKRWLLTFLAENQPVRRGGGGSVAFT